MLPNGDFAPTGVACPHAAGGAAARGGMHVPIETLLALLGVALLANLALIVVSPGPVR